MKKITLIIAMAFAGNMFAQTNSCFSRTDFNVGYSDESWNRQITTADFNGDGKADLATVDYDDNTFSVLLGDGAGNFADSPFIAISTGNCPKGLVSADFNGDGKADIAVTNNCDNNVNIYLGNGAGGFGAPFTAIAGSGAWGITAGDFNADTKMDLAVTNNNDDNVSVLIGNGNGTFMAPVNYSANSSPRSIATSDLNGDGKLDLAVTNYNDNSVYVYLGVGNGTFSAGNGFSTGSNPQTVIVADFNSDAKKDLAVVCWNDDIVAYLKGNGDGTFQAYSSVSAGNNPVSVTAADFNADGNLDMAVVGVVNDELSVMAGDGNGNFGSESYFNVAYGPLSLISADFNGDGKADIAIANREDVATVLLNVPLPVVSINASATSVCPGTAVILSGTGAGATYSVTYDIHQSDIYNIYSNCYDAVASYSNNFGFNWNDTLPSGANVTSIKVELNNNWNDYGSGHNGYMNYNYVGTPSNPYFYNWCYGYNTTDNIITYNIPAYTYNLGSGNNFYINTYGWWYAFSPNPTWGSGVYARVTVTYGASYSWSGPYGVAQGVPFTPGATANYVVTGTNEVGCANTASVTVTVNPVIVMPSINTTDVTCNPTNCNGTAVLNSAVTGGTSPYSYLWSNGNTTTSVSGLCAGTYTFTVTDAAGCKNTATATINNTTSVTISPANATAHATCTCNGSADMDAAGGTAPYSYLWSTGATTSAITGLCPGNYTLTATDANGCKATIVETINNTPAYTFSTVKVNAACTGTISCSGSATVTPSVAGTYTFVWSPSGGTSTTGIATGLCAKTYTVTATDGSGCTLSTNVVIGTTPIALSLVNINANCSTSCTGQSTVSVSGGTGPYTYAWAPSGGTNATATGLCGGSSYTVTVTDASGCSQKGSTTIGSNPSVMINNFNVTDATCTSVCNGTASANISGGAMPYTYSWSPAAGTNATATGLCESTYSLTVTDANGCTTTATVSIGNQDIEPSINTYNWNGASCNAVCNGWATVFASGGTGSLSYAWAPSAGTNATATGLCAQTNYTLTVTDALGCKDNDVISVGTDEMDLNVNTSDAACTAVCNGTAMADISNATGPFTYLWSNGATTSAITGLCSGTANSLTVTETNGCKTTETFNMYADNSLYVDIDHGWWDRATCKQSCDGTLYSDANDGYAPYTYLWSNGATTQDASGLCSGVTLMLTVTDSVGCKATNSELVLDRGWGVKVDYISTNDTWCNGVCTGDATVFTVWDQRVPIKYLWSTGSTTFQTTGLCADTYTITVSDSLNCEDTETFDIYANSAISFNTNNYNDASCEQVCNGTATVGNLSGAVSPVTYKWMPGNQTTATATGLCSGTTYSITVTDANGCTTMNTHYTDYDYDLSDDVYTMSTDASCSGICNGKDSAYATSGTGPYTYAWFPSGGTNQLAVNLCSGNYTVTVTDSVGCKGYESDFIDEGNPANINISNTDVYCNSVCNGTAVALVTGGTAPYTYTWTNGGTNASVSNLCAGTYGLTVKDASGCISNDQVTINATSATLTVSVASAAPTCNASCNGTAAATVNGGTPPYAYMWSPSGGSAATATGLCAGTYNVIITDANGCTQSTAVTLTQPASLVTNVTVVNSTSCVEGNGSATANVAGGNPPYSYVWTPTGQITQTAVVLANGSYAVVVTDAKGCTATGTGSVTCTSGIEEVVAANMFSVSPNPTTGHMIVTAANNVTINEIAIDNVLGQTVYSATNDKHQTAVRVDITSQPAGIYFLSVKANGNIYTQKIIKN